NTAPVAVADSLTLFQGGTTNRLDGGFLSVTNNDTDAEGDSLSVAVAEDVVNGTLTLNPDGTFGYTHDGSPTTNDSFRYELSDGSLVSTGLVNIAVIPLPPVQDPPYTTSFFVVNQFVDPGCWNAGAVGSTYQEWDMKSTYTNAPPDVGFTANPSVVSNPTHSVKFPGFRSGTFNFYAWAGHFGAFADIYAPANTGRTGTHIMVQIGTSLSSSSAAATYGDGTHGPWVYGQGVGPFWDTVRILDLNGNPIPGGANSEALQISQQHYDLDTPSAFGTVSYQELILEFYLPGYTNHFRVDWDENVHATIDTLRVDTLAKDEPCPITPVGANNDAILVINGTSTNEGWDGATTLVNNDSFIGSNVTVALVKDVTNGTLSLNSDGSFTYTHVGGVISNDLFTYELTDDSLVSTARVDIYVTDPIPVSVDIGVAKTVDDNTPDEGQTIAYTLIASNAGSAEATGVFIADSLP
ncbi:MAG: Ig-like domain-containing protein, partial [Verrucomicrobiota bacterium]